jgi:hypothetical protein
VKRQLKHPLQARQDEINSLRGQIRESTSTWRDHQSLLIPQLAQLPAFANSPSNLEPEHEVLYLPSDLTPAQVAHLDLQTLVAEELPLRQAQAHDALDMVRIAVKDIDVTLHDKAKNARGQDANTRSQDRISFFKSNRDKYIDIYNTARAAIIALGEPVVRNAVAAFNLPILTVEDCYRKPTVVKRHLGDSRRPDGALWTRGKVGQLLSQAVAKSIAENSSGAGLQATDGISSHDGETPYDSEALTDPPLPSVSTKLFGGTQQSRRRAPGQSFGLVQELLDEMLTVTSAPTG